MKTNAIVRIVLFSLAIVILGGILLAGIGLKLYSFDTPGFDISTNNGPGIEGGTVSSQAEVSASSIREIEIDWVAGSITIVPDETTDMITFCEYGNDDPDHRMVWKQSGDTLSIQYEESRVYVGVQVTTESKDLVITVPADWVCQSLEIDTASAEVNATDLTINEVDFDGASGICTFVNCSVGELDMDTASGDILFSGSVNSISVSAMSAACELFLTNQPSRIELESMSGDVELTLPEDSGFTLSMETMSGDFTTDFETTTKNGRHVCGNGGCRITIEGMSGNITIYKGAAGSHHPDPHHT